MCCCIFHCFGYLIAMEKWVVCGCQLIRWLRKGSAWWNSSISSQALSRFATGSQEYFSMKGPSLLLSNFLEGQRVLIFQASSHTRSPREKGKICWGYIATNQKHIKHRINRYKTKTNISISVHLLFDIFLFPSSLIRKSVIQSYNTTFKHNLPKLSSFPDEHMTFYSFSTI